MQLFSIYKFVNTSNSKVYVGRTRQAISKRKNQHLKDSSNGSDFYLHRAIRKYGEDAFEFEVIFNTFNEAELAEFEQHFIREYDCCVLDGSEKGYNMTRGGEGVHDADTARKNAFRQIDQGKNVFGTDAHNKLISRVQRNLVEAGEHHLQSDAAKMRQKDRQTAMCEDGSHPFLTSENKATIVEHQNSMAKSGTHNFQSEENRKRASDHVKNLMATGRHPSQKIRTCPHCEKTGKGSCMLRWHFENCKLKT